MLSVSNSNGDGSVRAIVSGPLYITGNVSQHTFLWCATARSLSTAGAGANQVIDTADRTAQTCFIRGLSEKMRIQTSTACPWMWRRICFTVRGSSATTVFSDTSPNFPIVNYFDSGTYGMARLWQNQAINTMPKTIIQQQELIFKGAAALDWNDAITAPVDTSRITVKYDKVFKLHTGNQSGYFGDKNFWIPLNQNLTYDDDETGAATNTRYFSEAGKAGMGDLFVYDIFEPGYGGTNTDILSINSNATLYWHER